MAPTKLQDVNDVDVRLAVVETKIENITDYFDEYKENFKELTITVNDMKERLDKQNGTLPHLVEAIKDLSKDFAIIVKKTDKHEAKLQANSIYAKIVWGIFMLIATSSAGVLADWIINHNK